MTHPISHPSLDSVAVSSQPPSGPRPTLYICGINHERSDLSVRERFALNREQCARGLSRLASEGLAPEGMLLSTCNRTELFAFAPEDESFALRLKDFFLSLATAPLEGHHVAPLYNYDGVEAVRHLFAVTSGLNSMILGENEIKAQVGQAYELSRETGMTGPSLHRSIEWANRCTKRIKTETELNVGTLCFGRASVMRAEGVLGSLTGKVCVVIGAGKVGRAAAIALAERKPARLAVINRTPEHAREVAEGLGAEIVSIRDMAPVLREADLIIGAAFAPNFLVTRPMFEAVRGSGSAERRVCLIDAAVPRILDHSIGELPGVTRLDIGDLEEIIAANRVKRTAASRLAWEIVEEEVAKFQGQAGASAVGPAIERLRQRFDEIFAEEDDPSGGDSGGEMRNQMHLARRKLKQRLLHEAICELKNLHSRR